jgi:hypothetical protein
MKPQLSAISLKGIGHGHHEGSKGNEISGFGYNTGRWPRHLHASAILGGESLGAFL